MAKKEAGTTAVAGRNAWQRFVGDKALLDSHGVTFEELEFLKRVSLFGELKSVDDYLLILRNIRETSKK
jgi:hypothetical protein